MLNKKFL